MKIKKKIGRFLLYIAVILILIWTLAPLVWMFISSIIPGKEMLEKTSILPKSITFERYISVFVPENMSASSATVVFRSAVINSIIVAGASTIISLLFGSLSAYAFARMRFRGKKAMLFTAMFFQLLPPIALVVPYYVVASGAGMLDKLITLIVINTNFILAYVIWVLNGYFKSIPVELEEAGRIDGCSWYGVYWKIIVPVAIPGFVAVGALSFLMAWDEFLYALVFTRSNAAKTIPVAVSEFGTKFGVDYGMMMTSGVLATIVPMLLALFFQKYIVSGLTAGAVKG